MPQRFLHHRFSQSFLGVVTVSSLSITIIASLTKMVNTLGVMPIRYAPNSSYNGTLVLFAGTSNIGIGLPDVLDFYCCLRADYSLPVSLSDGATTAFRWKNHTSSGTTTPSASISNSMESHSETATRGSRTRSSSHTETTGTETDASRPSGSTSQTPSRNGASLSHSAVSVPVTPRCCSTTTTIANTNRTLSHRPLVMALTTSSSLARTPSLSRTESFMSPSDTHIRPTGNRMPLVSSSVSLTLVSSTRTIVFQRTTNCLTLTETTSQPLAALSIYVPPTGEARTVTAATSTALNGLAFVSTTPVITLQRMNSVLNGMVCRDFDPNERPAFLSNPFRIELPLPGVSAAAGVGPSLLAPYWRFSWWWLLIESCLAFFACSVICFAVERYWLHSPGPVRRPRRVPSLPTTNVSQPLG